jgi:hypothetical protein
VAANGKVIERCMVVTTHNLALVFERFLFVFNFCFYFVLFTFMFNRLHMRTKLEGVMPELPRRVSTIIIFVYFLQGDC